MSAHKDPSKNWLILFFVCFIITIVGIGVYALLCYHADEQPVVEAAHGH
jgi:hypothetical protein